MNHAEARVWAFGQSRGMSTADRIRAAEPLAQWLFYGTIPKPDLPPAPAAESKPDPEPPLPQVGDRAKQLFAFDPDASSSVGVSAHAEEASARDGNGAAEALDPAMARLQRIRHLDHLKSDAQIEWRRALDRANALHARWAALRDERIRFERDHP